MSRPPSCTIHHTSMCPSLKRSWFCGNRSTFLATSRACCAAVVSRTVSVERQHTGQQGLSNTAHAMDSLGTSQHRRWPRGPHEAPPGAGSKGRACSISSSAAGTGVWGAKPGTSPGMAKLGGIVGRQGESGSKGHSLFKCFQVK